MTRRPQQERSRATVAKILAAADAEFSAHGGAATTTTRIAERAGVSVGALYRFFPDKHAIAAALADRYLEVARERFGALLADVNHRDQVPDVLGRVVEVAAGLALEHAGYYRLTNEVRPDQVGSVGHGVRTTMVDTFDGLLESLGTQQDPRVRRAAVTLVIETVRHTLAISPVDGPERDVVISELSEMVVIYARRRLGTRSEGDGE